MGELAASIAHEVNQPLCAIVSNAQAARHLLAAESLDLDEAREAVQDIAKDGQRASEVIARIRGFLQKAPPEHAPVDVNDLIREVCAVMRHDMSRRGVAIKLELADDLPSVLGRRIPLQQVILNLMANGADAMSSGARALRLLVIRSSADAAGTLTVTVRDAGVGIERADADRIFDAFFTTKPAGMGMGLAICKSIITGHGGAITALPNAEGGTTFQFTLPGYSSPSRSGAEGAAAREGGRVGHDRRRPGRVRGRRRPVGPQGAGPALEDRGVPLRDLRFGGRVPPPARPDVPACLILDMNLPGLNGMDLQRTLAKRNVRLPVIFLTGYGDIRLSVRAMKGGAADFLSKPFNPRELLSAVRHALAAQEETRQADADAAETRRRAAALSPREREVMALVVNGMLNKQAGSKLGVCEKTVKVHRARVMQKMGAESLAALVRMSEKIGVPPPRP